jgi:hypothetical protein
VPVAETHSRLSTSLSSDVSRNLGKYDKDSEVFVKYIRKSVRQFAPAEPSSADLNAVAAAIKAALPKNGCPQELDDLYMSQDNTLCAYDSLITAARQYSQVFENYDESNYDIGLTQEECGTPLAFLSNFSRAYPEQHPDQPIAKHLEDKIKKFTSLSRGDLRDALETRRIKKLTDPSSPPITWNEVMLFAKDAERRYNASNGTDNKVLAVGSPTGGTGRAKYCRAWDNGYCEKGDQCPFADGHTLESLAKNVPAKKKSVAAQLHELLNKKGEGGGAASTPK